jgi:hypothetical protein
MEALGGLTGPLPVRIEARSASNPSTARATAVIIVHIR